MTNTQLFRPEAIKARSTQWLGPVYLAQPISTYLAALLAFAVISMIAAFGYFGHYTKKATVTGLLEPGQGVLRIVSPASGSIDQILVADGDPVHKGQTLFTLSGERTSSTGETQAAIVRNLQTRKSILLADLKAATTRHMSRLSLLAERQIAAEAENTQADKTDRISTAREQVAERAYQRFEELATLGFVSPIQLQAKRDDIFAAQLQTEAVKQTKQAVQRTVLAIKGERAESVNSLAKELADLNTAIASIDQDIAESEARRSTVIRAPFDGLITGVSVRPGQVVGPGNLMGSLVPANSLLEAHIFVPSRQAGFIEPGQKVRLRYAAFPYQKFGAGTGTVIEVQRSPYALEELPAYILGSIGSASSRTSDPVYRASIRLDDQSIVTYGAPRQLQVGMTLEADVIEDRRRLIEWLLEPVYSLAGRT